MANEWQPNISKKIFITGGDDVQSNTLATYLAENATEVSITTLDLSTLQTPLTPGRHTIKVKAKGSGYYVDSAFSQVYYDVYQQLSAPATVTISDSTLSWAAVTNATSYSVYDVISGTPALISSELSTTSLNLSSISGLSVGQHTFKVKAIGSGYYTDSDLSTASANYTKYQQLSAPQITISGTTLSWSTIADAASYTLYKTVGGAQSVAASGISSSATSYDFSSVISTAGVYDLQLKAIGNGYYTDSQLSNTVGYITTPTTSITGDTLSISSIPDVESYGIYVNGQKRDTLYVDNIILKITPDLSAVSGGEFDFEYSFDNSTWSSVSCPYDTEIMTTLNSTTGNLYIRNPIWTGAGYGTETCDSARYNSSTTSMPETPTYSTGTDFLNSTAHITIPQNGKVYLAIYMAYEL